MLARRWLRVQVLEALDDAVKQFRRREELWPLRVPNEPVPLEDVVARAIPEEARSFDPGTLRLRTLLAMRWSDGSTWEAWMTALPSGVKLYLDTSRYSDEPGEETRILASGGRNEGDANDRIFLQLLAESAGAHFGIEMSGGAPSRVRSSIDDREFLIDLFVELLEVSGAEASVREQLPASEAGTDRGDFRADVERWLTSAVRSR